jgi:hypothetical protein
MTKRDKRIKILARRIGGMRTLLLVGFIDSLPHRNPDADLYFVPDHSYIQKVMKIRQPVYWALLKGLMDRGLVTMRKTEQYGRQYRVEFEAIEAYCRLSWLESVMVAWRALFGMKARKNA